MYCLMFKCPISQRKQHNNYNLIFKKSSNYIQLYIPPGVIIRTSTMSLTLTSAHARTGQSDSFAKVYCSIFVL